MKQYIYIIILVLLTACSSENATDCFQTSGKRILKEISVLDFSEILVNKDINLTIEQSDDYKVIVETGENLLNEVEVKVVGEQLQLTDKNSCNLIRDYGITKVYVTAPNITKIRSSSQFDITSNGTLNFSNLTLLSDDFQDDDLFAVGDFRINFIGDNLYIVSNKISSFYISGELENLNITFAAGAGRFEGADLIAQNVNIFHRGSNDIVVNPQESLSGELRSTGNIISVNEPPTVDVQQYYTGQLVFQN